MSVRIVVASSRRRVWAAHGWVSVRTRRWLLFVRGGLREASPLGVLVSDHEYSLLLHDARFAGMPAGKTLRAEFGSWDGVARWAQLLPHSAYTATVVRRTQEFIVELSQRLHGAASSVGCSRQEYDVFQPEYLLSSERLLRKRAGWDRVLWWACRDLRLESDAYYLACIELRMRQAVADRMERIVARSRLRHVEARLERMEQASTGLQGLERV